jgi:hypothetical protein
MHGSFIGIPNGSTVDRQHLDVVFLKDLKQSWKLGFIGKANTAFHRESTLNIFTQGAQDFIHALRLSQKAATGIFSADDGGWTA